MKTNSILAVVLAFFLSTFSGLVAALEVGDKAPDFELTSTKGGGSWLSAALPAKRTSSSSSTYSTSPRLE